MKRLSALLVALAIAVAVTACGGGSSSSSTLQTAYTIDPTGGLDPALFYDLEGESTLLSVYEGLLKYAPGTNKLVPSLATSWTISPDGKTYTFHLRKNVLFQDGTKFNSQAVKTSYEREIKLKGGPSYMLENVKSIETPDPNTVVFRLTQPTAPFLAYQASMYGGKVISPTALRKHADGDDAQKWLTTHAVGTGPFSLASYKGGQQIVLKRFDGYWGKQANLKTVVISINPNVGDQLLQLRSGQLDAIPHGISAAQLPSVSGDSSLEVETPTALIRNVLFINSSKPPFDNIKNREAAAAALDLPQVVSRIYPSVGQVPHTAYPPGLLPQGLNPPLPTTPAPKIVGSPSMALAYSTAEPDIRRMAELIQQQLNAAGFDVTLKGIPAPTIFTYVDDPKGSPEAVVSTLNPDTVHADAWARPIYRTGGGLNLFGYSNPKLDRVIDAASSATNKAQSERLYAKAGLMGIESYVTLPVVDLRDTIVARSGITGFDHVPAYEWSVNFSTMTK